MEYERKPVYLLISLFIVYLFIYLFIYLLFIYLFTKFAQRQMGIQ